MESMGALTSPIARLRLARSPRGFFSLLACSYCLLLVEGPALTAAADAGPPVTAVPPPAANAAAETPAPVPPASEIPRPPAKVPLRVVGARVALQTKVGGQDLLLGLDTCKEGLRLFSSGTSSCTSGRPAAVAEQHQQKQHQQQEHGGAGTREEEAKPVEQQRAGDSPVQRKRLHQPQNCYDPDLSPASMWCLNWHEVCTAFSETPFTCRPSKQHDPKYAAKYKQIVDGIVLSEVRLEGLDTVELSLPAAPSIEEASSVSLRLTNFPVRLVLERETEFDAFKGLDGIWGIAGPDLCCRNASLWNMLLEPTVSAVGLDINLPLAKSGPPSRGPSGGAPAGTPSFLHFGDDPKAIFGEMIWAERIQTGAAGFDALIHFSTYDWKLCGEPVGHPLSNSWEAIVDLSSECLVVPPPMWRSLRAWLPVDATHDLCKDPDSDEDVSKSSFARPAVMKGEKGDKVYRRTCPLLPSSSKRPLPAISFSLTQSYKENPRVQIPLEQLVINQEGIGEVLCVVPQPFLSMVLSALNVVMDRINWRVGLQEKYPEPSSDASCPTRAACIGDQIYVPYTNRCADPDCSVKILFEMNPDTKACEMAWWVPGAVVTAVAGLVALELFVLHLRKKVVAEACSGGQ